MPCSRLPRANANALILSSLLSRRFTPHLKPFLRPRHFGILELPSSPRALVSRFALLQKVVPRRERNRRRVCAKCAHPPPRRTALINTMFIVSAAATATFLSLHGTIRRAHPSCLDWRNSIRSCRTDGEYTVAQCFRDWPCHHIGLKFNATESNEN